MKLSKNFSPLLAGLALTTALMVSPALAEVVKFSATLDSAQEVPPTDSAGKGTLNASYDTDSKKLDWTLEYSELTGDATGAHFHGPAGTGENADVAIPIPDAKSGSKGSATLTDEQAKDLMDGKYYVNVHTAKYADGEIRGQVEKTAQ
ncbi:CHRD domain-containing protein [Pseudaminobacter salicylatoxidans]|uniref:CHRD domain-containing protein n=1 Tax=Pseudaminobacter salicylatoxidans TaxID=93369 RepID=UPI0002F6374A|nr:CHRD domain-containing protein [Pseudaminobacter salicylatoxidans]